MTRLITTIALAAITGCSAAAATSPEPGSNPAPPERAGSERVSYDPHTVETFDGRVLGADETSPEDQVAQSVRVRVSVDGGKPVVLHLGPGWYLDEQGVRYSPESRIHFSGSRVQNEGESVVVARDVEQDGRTIRLRDNAGQPLWSRPLESPPHTKQPRSKH